MSYGKLVRDNIPDIIERNGETPVFHILSQEKMKKNLFMKLLEEYKEVAVASMEYQQNVKKGIIDTSHVQEELGDVLEVIMSLANIDGMEEQEVLFLAHSIEPRMDKDLATYVSLLKRIVLRINKIRQIHKRDYIELTRFVFGLASSINLQEQDVINAMMQKRTKNGGFTKRIFLDNVIKK